MKPSALFLFLCLGLFTTAAWAALKPGDAAPDFTVDAALGGGERGHRHAIGGLGFAACRPADGGSDVDGALRAVCVAAGSGGVYWGLDTHLLALDHERTFASGDPRHAQVVTGGD